MRQHDQPELELYRHGNARALARGIHDRRKEHCDRSGRSEREHVHGAEKMPKPLNQRQHETQRVERLSYVVLVEIGIAKKSSGGVMVVEQPGQQRKNWNARNRGPLNTASTLGLRLQQFPKSKCQRRYYRSLFAQDSEAKGELAGPNAPLNIKPDAPKGECGSHKIGMGQRTLYKKDWEYG